MNTLESWPDNPFWDFSIDFYGRDGVEERLFLLQEKLHVDVNLELYCYWAGYIGAPFLTESDVNNASELIKAWQKDIVQPLRVLRSKLKNNSIIKQNFCNSMCFVHMCNFSHYIFYTSLSNISII